MRHGTRRVPLGTAQGRRLQPGQKEVLDKVTQGAAGEPRERETIKFSTEFLHIKSTYVYVHTGADVTGL